MRLIDADTLAADVCAKCQVVYEDCKGLPQENGCRTSDCILDAPTVDIVKHGHWSVNRRDLWHFGKCSVCGKAEQQAAEYYQYCPHCGSKMDEEVVSFWK